MEPATQNRVAVVTGGSRGIGRGIILALAKLGFTVVVNYRSDSEAADSTLKEALAVGAADGITAQADVSDLAEGRNLVDFTIARFGRIDFLVNNAGVAPKVRLDLLETTPESWDRVLGINLRGPFFLSQYVGKLMAGMVAKGTVADPAIVFVTSVSSTHASVNRGEYCVSKAGLSMVSKLFAFRLAELGVRTFEVRPGIIATDMTGPVKAYYDRRIEDGLSPIRRWGTPEDVGKAVAAIASGAFPFSTGEVLHVDGGFHVDRL